MTTHRRLLRWSAPRKAPTRGTRAGVILLLLMPAIASAQEIQPGKWDVTSTAVDMVIPGAPDFLVRMMKGRSKTERKCVAPEQAMTGIAALLVPDPKAKCSVESVQIAGGRYTQALICPNPKGPPLRITRTGTYSDTGFTGRLTMTGQTPKGPMAITLDQKASHLSGTCAP